MKSLPNQCLPSSRKFPFLLAPARCGHRIPPNFTVEIDSIISKHYLVDGPLDESGTFCQEISQKRSIRDEKQIARAEWRVRLSSA